MDCDGKCKGRMRDCCNKGEGEDGAHKVHGKVGANEKPEWVQAVAVGIIVLFVLGILLRGM